MPFAPPGAPSLGLTQIESVVRKRFGAAVDIRTHYLNLDFFGGIGDAAFYHHAVSAEARVTGAADWFFRSAAFPGAPDNSDEYLARYYFGDDPESVAIADFLRRGRPQAYALLDELIARYDLASSDVVGFTLSFFQTTASIALANRLKALNPELCVVFGGPAVRGAPGRTLVDRAPAVDFVVSGAGLVSFPEMIACLLENRDVRIAAIPGVLCAGVRGNPAAEDAVGAALEINTPIELDYTAFLDKFYASVDDPAIVPYLLFQTSRGCWRADIERCTFCGLNALDERFEAMTPECALRHIRAVLAYAGRVSYFVACDNVAPPNYFTELFPQLEARPGVYIKYETRSDLTAAQIKTLCDAGIRCVQPGVEALSTESLKLMRKGVSAFGNIGFLKECRRFHLYAEWNILLFSPGESETVYHKYESDIPLLAHLQPPVGVFPIEFARDSCYFENAARFGLELEPEESLAYIYPFERAALFHLALRFADRSADTAKIDRWLGRLGESVAQWREKWNVPPHQRPRLVLWSDECGTVICDSRSGAERTYRIPEEDAALLTALEQPLTLRDAAARSALPQSGVQESLDRLLAHGLLFQENGRFLALTIKPVG